MTLWLGVPICNKIFNLWFKKWRQYQFTFTADIEKHFRQIWVNEKDQSLQKIVWRDSPKDLLREYQLTTVTYGTKVAPFLAMMTLRQFASDEKENYQQSQAAKVIEESFYMDDLLHGAHSIDQAKQLQQDLIKLLKSGGFVLRKWASNSIELLQNIKNEKSDQQKFEFRQAESTKTLGLRWIPGKDVFSFESKISTDSSQSPKNFSKRTLLSEISKLFDPLDWLAPLSTKQKFCFKMPGNNTLTGTNHYQMKSIKNGSQ